MVMSGGEETVLQRDGGRQNGLQREKLSEKKNKRTSEKGREKLKQ